MDSQEIGKRKGRKHAGDMGMGWQPIFYYKHYILEVCDHTYDQHTETIDYLGANLIFSCLNPASKQLSGLFIGSPVFQQLIDDNDIDICRLLDHLMVALKWVSFILPVLFY